MLLLFPPGLDFVAAFFGCLYAGATAVPAYPPRPNRPQPRLRSIARDASPKVALANAALVAAREGLAAQVPELAGVAWLAADAVDPAAAGDWRPPELSPESLAFLQYTSGSTATPKGVMVSHGGLMANEELIRRAFGQSAESVIVGWLPLYHDMGLIGNVLQPLYAGGRCILMSPLAFLQRPARWLEAISRYRATTSGGPNFAYELCLKKASDERIAGLDLSSWTVAFNGAEPVRADTLDRFAARFAPCGFHRTALFPCYGLAEATLFVTGGSPGAGPEVGSFAAGEIEQGRALEGGDRRLVSSGRAGEAHEVAIVDPETGERLDPGRIGEIWVAGPSVAAGYWNRGEATAESFAARTADGAGPFLRTGDLGFQRSGPLGAELFVTGRIKDLIIVRGRNHYPQDLELTAERSHPALRPGCGAAFSVERPMAGAVGASGNVEEQLVIVHELERGRQAEAEAAQEAIRSAIAEEHEVRVEDVVLIRVGTLPKTSSGKIQRRACRQLYLDGGLDVVLSSSPGGRAEAEPGETGSSAALIERAESGAEEGVLDRLRGLLAGLAEVGFPAAVRWPADRSLTALGLDSLAAIELQSRFEAEFGVELPLADLLGGLDLRGLARLAQSAQSQPNRSSPPSESAGGPPSREAAVEEGGPLSIGQRGLWFQERAAPHSGAYNLAAAFEVRGDPAVLDPSALQRALAVVAARHAVLRTTYVERDGEPVRVVHPELPVTVAQHDATGWVGERLAAKLSAAAYRPFDLEREAPLRVDLFRRGAEPPILLLTIHHLATDFRSVAILARDLAAAYATGTSRGAAKGRLLPAASKPVPSYGDFVRWQTSWLASPEGGRAEAFWRERLAADRSEGALDLPADRPRPEARSFRAGSVPLRLDRARTAALEGFLHGRGATLFAGLLAAFQALLQRHSGQASIRVGAPALGRTAPATRDAVGYFVNPIVLGADVSSHSAFGAHLDDQAARVRAALDHQAYPFPLLVENLSGGREPGRAPLFQALLALHRGERLGEEPLAEIALGTGGARLPLGNLELVSLPLAEGRSEFDLTLTAAATREGLALLLGYAADLFDRTTALRWAEDLDALLADLVHRPDAPVAALDRLDPARRQQVLTARNERAAMREGAGATGPAAGEAPRTPSERQVAAVWGDVLGRESIDRNDDFFRIGGHSLLAVRVASQLRTRLGVDLPLPVLLRLPTVAALAAEIDRRREAAPDPAAGAIRLPILPRGERGAAPLSFEQRRLWFLDRLDEEGAAYNLAGVLAFAGPLDRGALAASLAELVRRHEALRTRFSSDRVADGGEPLQIAAPFLPDAGLGGSGDLRGLPAVDLSGLTGRSEAWGRAEAGRLAAAFARLRFDLERGPPVRFALLAHGAETTDLALAIHHIVADGGSIGVLAREIAALYGAVAAGRPSPLAEPALQAADVAVWQRREESAGVLADDLDFWRRELEEVPSLDLATDRPRPALPRFRGGRASVALAPTLAEALAALARSASATPFMLELAVWGALLARWSGQIDFALGTPVANRDRAELEPLVGCFVNTLALRLRLDPSAGFDAFLKRVRESSLAAYAHRELPFDLLVEALQPERGASRSPLFEAFFALDEPLPALRLPGLDVSLREIETGTAKFDLALALGMPDDRGTHGHFEYDSDLFDAATVERLARRWERLAAAVAAQPEAPLFEIDLLSDEERREIAAGQGPRLERTPVRLEARFFAQAARRPEAVALVTGATGEEMTYAELAARARRLAARLRALGVGPEVRVGLCTGRGPEMVAGMLGILAAGGAYVPLDPAYPPERLRYLLEDSGARLVVTAEGARERLPEGGFVAVAWDAPAAGAAEEIAASGRSERPAPPLLESLAYLIYTSGSTGRPKGVGIPHRSVSEFLDWVAEGFSAEELSGVLAATSMCFDLSVFELFGPLSHGGAVVLAENALALAGLAASARARLRLVNTVPSALGEVLRADLLPPSVVTVSLAGEPLPESLAARALATGGVRRVLNLYGPSEDTTYSTWGDAGAEVGTKVTIGRPLPNTRAAVFEPRAAAPTLAWPGATGELALGSASLARGYLGRPAETAESFRPDPSGTAPGARLYLTRDLVRRRPDGRLDFLGRRDHQVKVRGFRIELGEVEAALAAAPGVSEAAVAVERSAERPDRLVAYVAGGASLDAVRADLAARLPAHLVPSAWVGLAALPRTPNGKLDRKALPAPDAVVRPRRAPRTETERRLAALWAEVLGVAEIGAEDGFFDLGGHSLLAARVATRVKRDFGLDLSVRDLFARPTLAGLAARIEELRAEREESRGSPAANARRGARGERAEPETVAEWALAGIWCAVLDRARIDRDDDFFSAGGHSLLAAQVAARVRRAFGVDLSARELFARPTLRALAARIEELARAGAAEVEPAAPISPIASDAAAGEPRPISFAQERIWFLEQLEGPSALYNLPALVHLAGELDVPALGASFSWIAARHEAVRATFQVTADGPRQRISPPRPVPLPVADFSALGAGARQAVASAASRAARRPFDLARGPLLRTSLFRLAPGEAAVLFALHHVAADGWSLGILAEELAVAYPALAERRAPLLPEPPIQYSDYAAWQRESLSAERRAAEVAWWRDALAGLPPVLELPTDRPRPAERSPRGGTLPVRLPEGLLPAVDALARRSGATRFMVLLAAFQLLLGRLAGREETAVGTPVANRGMVEVEGLIGCFVNTLVLRADLQGAPSFSRLLERVRETAAGAFAHEAIPFEMLVDALAPDRSLDQSPLFQVLFALQPAPAPLVLPGLAATVSEVATGTAKFDLSLSLFDAGPRMTGFAEWSADLFDAPTVERLLARYQRLLAAAVASPETPIDAIPWLTEAEERQVREGGGEPAIGRLPPGSRERRGDPLPPGALRVHRPPRTPTERAVAAIWSEVLGVSGIGLDHGFFELGGHSLLAVRVAVRLREEFGVELVLRDQFAYPTLERLAARIEEEQLARAGDENLDALLDQLEEAAGRPAGLVSLVRTDFTTRD